MHQLTTSHYAFISETERPLFEKNMLHHYRNLCRLDHKMPVFEIKDIGISSYFYDFCMSEEEKGFIEMNNLHFLIDHYQNRPEYQKFLQDVELFFQSQHLTFHDYSAKGGFSCAMH